MMEEREEEDDDKQKLSKRKQKILSRLSVAELKQLVFRPDVVEMHDVTAKDPGNYCYYLFTFLFLLFQLFDSSSFLKKTFSRENCKLI